MTLGRKFLTDSNLFSSASDQWAHERGFLTTTGTIRTLFKDTNLSELTDKNAARVNLGLRIGYDVQAHSSNLDLVSAAPAPTEFGLSLISKANAEEVVLEIGSSFPLQARNANLDKLSLASSISDFTLSVLSASTATQWRTGLGAGTVSSVSVSGGTTGLTFTGGVITTVGVSTLSGVLSVTNGGTGVTSLTALKAALNFDRIAALTDVDLSVPQTAGQALVWNAGTSKWTPAPVTAASLDTDATLTANADTRVPSQKAIKSYVDNSLVNRVALSPEMFGDASDWATAFELCVTAADGGPILLEKHKVYTFNRACSITKNMNVDMNGATVIAPFGWFVATTRVSYTNGNYFNTVAGSNTIPIPSGVTISAGQWLTLRSNTVRLATGSYKFGEAVEVMSVAGGFATLREPLLASYQVDIIRTQSLDYINVSGGILDITGMGLQPTNSNPYSGIDVEARRVNIDLDIRGGVYSGRGLNIIGVYVDLRGQASGITNDQGFNTSSNNGRLGYGMSASGGYIRVSANFTDCKHGFTSADREILTRVVSFVGTCKGSTPKGQQATLVTFLSGAQEPKYQAPFDTHANVIDTFADALVFDGVNSACMFRGKRVVVNSLVINSRGVTNVFGQNLLVYLAEENTESLLIRKLKVSADIDTTAVSANTVVPYAVGFNGAFANSVYGNVDVMLTEASNVGLFSFEPQASGQSLGNVKFHDVRGSLTRGFKIGGTSTIVSVGDMKLSGKFSLMSELTETQYSVSSLLLAYNFTAGGVLELSGEQDATKLASGYAAAYVYGKTDTLVVGASKISGVYTAGLKAKTSGRGLEIGCNSTASDAVGPLEFAGQIEFNNANLASSSGVRVDILGTPIKAPRFRGGVVRNLGQSTANTPAVQFQNVNPTTDYNGFTTNDSLLPASNAYVPLGLTLETKSEILWRSSTPNIYYDRSGLLTADTIPTTGAFPVKTEVRARTPNRTNVPGWVYASGPVWTPLTARDSGNTAARPTAQMITGSEGYQYFDTTIGKPLWWDGTTWVDPTAALPGPLTAGVWEPVTGLPRLLLNGTGTVSIDTKNRAGTITAAVYTTTLAGAVNLIDFPYFGDDALAIRVSLTGSATAEIV